MFRFQRCQKTTVPCTGLCFPPNLRRVSSLGRWDRESEPPSVERRVGRTPAVAQCEHPDRALRDAGGSGKCGDVSLLRSRKRHYRPVYRHRRRSLGIGRLVTLSTALIVV
jgi:hypothetical protein